MKKSTKIRFGGNMKLGGGRINQCPSWSGPEDVLTIRELGKNFYRLKTAGLDWYNKTYGTDFKIAPPIDNDVKKDGSTHVPIKHKNDPTFGQETYQIDLDKYFKKVSQISVDHYQSPMPEYSTGYYKLRYNGKTTRKIKHYCTADDIKYVIDQDIAQNLFEVSTIGHEESPAFGPYFFQASNVGMSDIIEIIDQNDKNKISGSITGHKGDLNSQSSQTLSFTVDPNVRTFSTEYHRMNPDTEYVTEYFAHTKNLKINNIGFSGVVPKDSLASNTEDHESIIRLKSSDEEIKYISSFTLVELRNDIFPLISGGQSSYQAQELDAKIKITGWETGVYPLEICNREVASLPITIDEPEGGYDEAYHFAGAPYFFTGIRDHADVLEINISKSNDIKGFFIHNGERARSTIFCKKITMTGNPNMSHFWADSYWINNVREINLSGCGITGFNERYGGRFPELLKDHNFGYGTNYDHTLNLLGCTGLNFHGNRLNSTGIYNVIAPLALTQRYSGYIDIRNQNPPIGVGVPVGITTGIIDYLSGLDWIIDYDK